MCSATADVRLTAVMQVLDDMLQLQVHKIVHRDLTLWNLIVLGFHTSPNEHGNLRSNVDEQCWRLCPVAMDAPGNHVETPMVGKEQRVGARGHSLGDVHTWTGSLALQSRSDSTVTGTHRRHVSW